MFLKKFALNLESQKLSVLYYFNWQKFSQTRKQSKPQTLLRGQTFFINRIIAMKVIIKRNIFLLAEWTWAHCRPVVTNLPTNTTHLERCICFILATTAASKEPMTNRTNYIATTANCCILWDTFPVRADWRRMLIHL